MFLPVDHHFHRVHSDNVQLSSNFRVVTRKSNSDNGFCALEDYLYYDAQFSCDPKVINRFSFLVTRTDARWSGSLGIGVSSNKPSGAQMSPTAINKQWLFAQMPQLELNVGTLVTTWINPETRALYYVTSNLNWAATHNSGPACVLLNDPEILDCLDAKRPLWFYMNISGFIVQVKIFGAALSLP